jgi:S-DNA-T family DNA segregation ATPase FtsK/SpoIIIE
VLRRLGDLNPGEYANWSFQPLAAALANAGIAARKSDGVMVVRAADIARALAERDDDEDDADE